MVMEIGYSIIGCIIFNQINADCQVTALGKMLLAFVILTWMVNFSRAVTVVIGWESGKESYSRIKDAEIHEDEYVL